jgi:Spy/CpxP family protein refolding chaperone
MAKFRMLLVAVLLAGFGAFAQDSSQPAPSTAGPKHMRGDRAEHRLKRLSKKLNLTDDQKEKVRPILQDEEKQLTSLESDSTLSTQQKRQKTREIRMASRSQMEAILTPEQKEKIQSGGMHGAGHHRMSPDKTNSGSADSSTSDQQQ